MTNNKGENTKFKVLSAAEKLFANKGFHATSVAEITEAAGVNKALVYYYFKNKDDIVASLFRSIVEELDEHVRQMGASSDELDPTIRTQKKVAQELAYLSGKQQILAVLLMETLKGGNADNFLFQCAETVIQQDIDGPDPMEIREGADEGIRQRFLAEEFFMGFIPLISFVVFRDKWCAYFKCDPDKAIDYFLETFARSHLAFQSKWDDHSLPNGE